MHVYSLLSQVWKSKLKSVFGVLSILLLILVLPRMVAAQTTGQVRLIYFLPKDRTAQSDINTKMDTMIKEAQLIFAEQMENHGFGGKTFQFETDGTGNALVHHVTGKFDDAYYHNPSWVVWEEIEEKFDLSQNIYFVALDISNEYIDYPNSEGIFFCGRAWIYGGRLLLPASSHCFTSYVLSHELAHTFGLWHDFRTNKNLIPNSYINWDDPMLTSFCAAEWLDVHPFFNGGQSSLNQNTTIQMLTPIASPPNAIRLRFEVTDADGLHQAQLVNTTDLGLIGYVGLDGTSTTVEFVSTHLTLDAPTEVRLQVVDTHGNYIYETFPLNVSDLLPGPINVSIPDANLRSIVKENLGLAPEDAITSLNILNLKGLDAIDRGITDLTGLEHATHLRTLNLNGNQVSDVTPLGGLTNLVRLYLSNNQITDVSPLAGLSGITVLSLGGNEIADILSLTGLRGLRLLELTNNHIVNISPLRGLTRLVWLYLSNNQITDVSPLTGMTYLEYLSLYYNNITNPDVLYPLLQLNPPTKIDGVTFSNNPPVVVSPISSQVLTNGGPTAVVDISVNFRDPDDDTLTYTASSSNTAIATVSVSGNQLTITPSDVGSGTITVTASDGELIATQTFSVTVNPSTLDVSPDLVVSLSTDKVLLAPNEYFILKASVQNQGNADASNTTTLRYYISSDTTVSSDDQLLATDSVSSLTQGDSDDENHGVRAPSQPGQYYYYACVDSVTGEDDTGNNCSNFISINVRGSDLVVDSVSVDLLGQTTGINPRGAFTLNATIRNKGTDSAASTTARIYISADQTFSITDDSEVQIANISSLNTGTSTTVQFSMIRSSFTSGVFYCFICLDSLSNETDTGNNCSEPIQITVRNVSPRKRGRIPTQTLNIGTPKSLGVSNYFVDDNHDTLTYQVSSSDDNIATATVAESQVTITPKNAGSATIMLTANDGSLTATQTVSVSVIDPNRAPLAVGTIAALTLTVGDAPKEIDVSSKFRDPDNDALKYTASSNNTIVATVTMTEAKLTITPKSVGNATITVTATDGKLTATQTVSVSVVAANRAPTTVGTISAQALIAGGSSVSVNVSDKFSDPDNDTLTYSAISSNTSIATVSVSNFQVTIIPVSAGNATITVAASDGKFFATQTISVSVVDPNRTPVAVGTISARTLTVEDSAIQIDVSSNFSDPDNDTLTYSASSNDDNVATTSTSGSTVTITPVGTGSATITVTAGDGALTTTQTISITITAAVVANSAPFTVGAISSQTLTEGGSAIQIDVASNFSDPDGDTLTYSASSNDDNVATTSTSGSTVTITPVGTGSATITVTASDSELTTTQTISVTITAATVANRAPITVGSISGRTLTVGDAAVQIDVASNFSDPDGNTLTYSASSDNSSVATVTVSGSQITITSIAVGSATITVTASDSELTTTQTISVTITAAAVANRAPFTVGAISARALTVGGSAIQIDVASNFSDPDDDTLTYTANSNNTNVATATVSGSIVAITPKSVGSATITVTASDSELAATQTISVTITAAAVANRTPVTVGSISGRTLTDGDAAVQIDVSSNFNDPDGNTLTYTANSSNTNVATATASGSQITITPAGIGTATITVTASDGSLTATQTISVTVAAAQVANRSPDAVGSISARTLTVGDAAIVINVFANFSDPDDDTLTYTANSSNTNVATATVSGSIVTITPKSAGSATITVTANDGELTATQTISVTVTAAPIPNRAPFTVGAIPSRTFTAGDSATTVNVSSNFNDPDNDTLTYTASSNNNNVATASASGAIVTITPMGVGSATITVTASDGSLSATQTISVTVNAANRAPTAVGAIPAQTLTASGSALLITVSSYFTDPDNDNLTYTATSSNSSVATASASGARVLINAVAVGTVTITVTASDRNLTATQTISVTVNAANRAPTAVGAIPAQTLTAGGSALLITVSSYFTDPDNDDLTYTATSSNSSVATASASGARVAINAGVVGTATITVTASDGSLSATQTISVTVEASTPTITPVNERTQQVQDAIVAAVNGIDSASDVTATHLAAIRNLDLNSKSITSLKSSDFDGLTALTWLFLSGNSISDISAVSGLTSLTWLSLGNNSISDISAVSGLTSLTTLDLDNNSISDISAVSGLTSLTRLWLSYNSISDISAVSGLTSLTTLYLSYNSISDISAVSGLTSLTSLHLSNNSISDISAVSGLTSLTSLDLSNNSSSDISAVSGLTSLTWLHLDGNSISDISAVSGLTSLTSLGLDGNSISDISAVSGLTSLTWLGLNNNSISDISAVSGLTSLPTLWLRNNSISDISAVSGLTSLTFLGLSSNSISDVSALEGLTSLEILRLRFNPISDYAPLRTLVAAIEADGRTLSLDITIPPAAPAITTPTQTSLLPNYPNPFNPETWIPYQLAKPSDVILTFYNVQGKVVRQLALGHRAAGVYYSRTRAAHWDGKNNLGEKVSTGVYFVKFKAGNYTKTRKMLIRK